MNLRIPTLAILLLLTACASSKPRPFVLNEGRHDAIRLRDQQGRAHHRDCEHKPWGQRTLCALRHIARSGPQGPGITAQICHQSRKKPWYYFNRLPWHHHHDPVENRCRIKPRSPSHTPYPIPTEDLGLSRHPEGEAVFPDEIRAACERLRM